MLAGAGAPAGGEGEAEEPLALCATLCSSMVRRAWLLLVEPPDWGLLLPGILAARQGGTTESGASQVCSKGLGDVSCDDR